MEKQLMNPELHFILIKGRGELPKPTAENLNNLELRIILNPKRANHYESIGKNRLVFFGENETLLERYHT